MAKEYIVKSDTPAAYSTPCCPYCDRLIYGDEVIVLSTVTLAVCLAHRLCVTSDEDRKRGRLRLVTLTDSVEGLHEQGLL